ncbi:MAG: helix-turn-helix domain-containing protein, partial [Chloroflexi bacterium]|nr:helix-turn-helix domain-containing protein [Chloroflexota bacterium]
MLTIREILASLPAGTRVVAGRAGLDGAVTWVVSLRTRPPIFPALKGGELALVAVTTLGQIEPPIQLEDAIRRLGDRGVAAIGAVGQASQAAIAEAERRSLPLLALPADTPLSELESTLVRLIGEQRTELYQWGNQVDRCLAEVSMSGGGLTAMAALLAELLGLPVVWQDALGRLAAVEAPAAAGLGLAEVKQDLADPASSGTVWSVPAGTVVKLPGARSGWTRWGVRVAVGRGTAGYLSVFVPAGRTGTRERLALERAGLAFAQEAAKERAVQAAESRLRGDFLNALLTASASDLAEIQLRSRQLGVDLAQPLQAVVFQVGAADAGDGAGAAAELLGQRLSQLAARPGQALVSVDDGRLVALVPAAMSGKRLAEDAVSAVLPVVGTIAISAGVGRPHVGAEGVRTSFREARAALEIGIGLYGSGKTVAFDDLGAYRLLYALREHPELLAFFSETLGALQQYDRENDTEMLRTLEVYFACDGVLNRAAEQLYLHRNSLAYRMRRIEEITRLSLDSAEARLHMHLALKIWRLAGSQGPGVG